MIVVINAPPVSKLAGIAKEFKWLDRYLLKLKNKVDDLDYYPIEPKDWNDPSYHGVNVMVRDIAPRQDIPDDKLDEFIEQFQDRFQVITNAEMYIKLHNTFTRIFDAMEEVFDDHELDVIFPPPAMASMPDIACIFANLHGVFYEQFNIVTKLPVHNNQGMFVAIRYVVRRKDLKDDKTNSSGLARPECGDPPGNNSGGSNSDTQTETSTDI